MLPQDFLDRMRQMLETEFDAFLASYETEKYQALRINVRKTNREHFLEQTKYALKQVPWSANGFYYESSDTPGKHPYHEAGVYYIQEPSAMAPVEFLMHPMGEEIPAEEERILDLCAAPGGKSTQIAAAMNGKGVLLCNEIHPARAKILSENVERMGIRNAMVTNETPQHLAEYFSEYFTRILVDAPCSGEGMFRKNEVACEEWSLANVVLCAERQDDILEQAASMLAPGGRIVYSTCTFAPAENEGSISRFLERHSDFYIEKAEPVDGMEPAVPAWGEPPYEELRDTIRLWPHKLKGEGHYLAVLRKSGNRKEAGMGWCKYGMETGMPEKQKNVAGKGCVEYLQFLNEVVKQSAKEELMGKYLTFGEQLYLIPDGMPSVKGLKVLRPGLHLGTIKKNRFEPSHALALTLEENSVEHTLDLSAESAEIRAYLNGETIPADGEKGWYLLLVDGYSIGWGKLASGIMKNHYPKGLRKQL